MYCDPRSLCGGLFSLSSFLPRGPVIYTRTLLLSSWLSHLGLSHCPRPPPLPPGHTVQEQGCCSGDTGDSPTQLAVPSPQASQARVSARFLLLLIRQVTVTFLWLPVTAESERRLRNPWGLWCPCKCPIHGTVHHRLSCSCHWRLSNRPRDTFTHLTSLRTPKNFCSCGNRCRHCSGS